MEEECRSINIAGSWMLCSGAQRHVEPNAGRMGRPVRVFKEPKFPVGIYDKRPFVFRLHGEDGLNLRTCYGN